MMQTIEVMAYFLAAGVSAYWTSKLWRIGLRDYFAAKALPECIGWGEPDEICAKAYEYADAMLKAREE